MTARDAGAAFSPATLYEAAGGDPALVAELLAIFARTVPAMLQRFSGALAAGHAAAVALEAHDLKACLALVGAPEASAACARIETSARRAGTCPSPAEGALLCARVGDIIEQVARYRAAAAHA